MEKQINHNYLSAIKCYENVLNFLDKNQTRPDYPMILKQLKMCLTKIEALLISESDTNSTFMISLFQLKQEVSLLIYVIEKKIANPPIKNNYELSINVIQPKCVEPQEKLNKTENCNDNDKEKLLRIVKDTIQKPRVAGLKDIAGLWEIRKSLKTLVILPKKQPQLFQNVKICNSVLLYGPPGTGKTRLVHALAAESSAILYSISASDVFSPYIGQSEKTIKAIFHHIKQNESYAILFIDEIDGFCRKRSANEHEHTRRLKTELMCQLSDIENSPNLFLICATNCPWDLDTAILRRFQKRIYVPLPNRCERLEFLRLFTQNKIKEISSDHWSPLLNITEGYSGSDLANLVQTAFNIPITELEDAKIWKMAQDGLYEPIQFDQEDLSNVVCSDLSDLPPNSVRSRKVVLRDFLAAAENVAKTVPTSAIPMFEEFH